MVRVRTREDKLFELLTREARRRELMVQNKEWEIRDGTIIKLSDMSEGHLLNCAYKIVKESWRTNHLDNVIEEINSRGLHQEARSILNLKKMNDSLE